MEFHMEVLEIMLEIKHIHGQNQFQSFKRKGDVYAEKNLSVL